MIKYTVSFIRKGSTFMRSKKILNISSKIVLLLLSLLLLVLLIELLEFFSRIFYPTSGLTESFGILEPVFSFLNIHFYQEPVLYSNTNFIILTLMNRITTVTFAIILIWLIYKLLRNLTKDKFFTMKNVAIIRNLGINAIILGSISNFTEGLLLSKIFRILDITNANITFSNMSYLDTILNGVLFILISYGMKIATRAIEENEQTI